MIFIVLTELDSPITYVSPTTEQAALPKAHFSTFGKDTVECLGTLEP